jgi:hypothetical protein
MGYMLKVSMLFLLVASLAWADKPTPLTEKERLEIAPLALSLATSENLTLQAQQALMALEEYQRVMAAIQVQRRNAAAYGAAVEKLRAEHGADPKCNLQTSLEWTCPETEPAETPKPSEPPAEPKSAAPSAQ